MRTVVVGAGLSGLVAARTLHDAGHEVTVFDKGRGVGGRLATRRIDAAVLDHGAQFFTVRSDEFAAMVDGWSRDGVVREWCRGFGEADGHPRYVGAGGMTAIAKHLARGLDVRTSSLVFSLRRSGVDGWIVRLDDGTEHACDRVLLTAPLPQSYSLLFSADIEMPADLRGIDYDRTLGLLVTLASNGHLVASPGGMQDPDEVFSFIGDNVAKGVSAIPAVTFHANADWSLRHFEEDNDTTHTELLRLARPWIGEVEILSSELKKWRFATPRSVWPERCWTHESGTLALAGDAFAGPKVEGAVLSGLAAARSLSK